MVKGEQVYMSLWDWSVVVVKPKYQNCVCTTILTTLNFVPVSCPATKCVHFWINLNLISQKDILKPSTQRRRKILWTKKSPLYKGVEITEFAVPSAVKAGENVELQCRIALLRPQEPMFMVKWWLKGLGDNKKVQLYQRLDASNLPWVRDKILWKANETIEIVDIQANYSGTYECIATNYNEESRKQELIVYTPGTGPNLTITEVQSDAGDKYIQLTCTAEGVAPEPELLIFVGVEKQQSSETSLQEDDTGLWSVAANATVAAIEDGAVVSCELFFKNAKISHEQYADRTTYTSWGGEPTTSEMAETTIAITTAQQNGNGFRRLICSWLVVLLASCSLLLQ